MAKQPETQSGPEESGPIEAPTKALPPTLLSDARPGERQGLARAFGHAGAWLRAGKAPPDELARWVGERLLALSGVLSDPHDKKLHGVNAALGLTAPGKRGRKPATQHEIVGKRFMAWDVYYERRLTNDSLEVIYQRVADRACAAKAFITPTQVETAWKGRKNWAPEIPEMDS